MSDVLPATTARSRRLTAGFAWAAITVTIFAGWFVVTRFGVSHHTLRVWDVIALRFGGGAVLLLPALLRPGHRLLPRLWLEGLLYAILWGAPFVLFVTLGLELTSAAEASSVTPALMPVFAGLLGWLVLGEAPGRLRLLGYGAIVAGLAGLVAVSAAAQGRFSLPGILALAVAALMWAVYTLRFRRGQIPAIQAAALICLWSAVLYLPVYFLAGLSRLDMAGAGELVFQALYQGLLMSAVAIVTFNRAVTLLGAGAATAIIALLPTITTTLALPVLHEAPSLGSWVAIAVIAAGVLLAARPTPPSSQ
jgi:drug/metabolite transporter (DMT)-like permease